MGFANLTDSQFKTFRADVRREVRSIANEIKREIYDLVVGEARVVAAQTARKHVNQMAHNGEFQVQNRLENLDTRLKSVERVVTKKALQDMGAAPLKTPKNFTTIHVDGERFTFFRGEWRRDSQMEEFSRQACERHDEVERKFHEANNALLASVEELRKFTGAGF